MSLSPGARLGVYEILAPLGAGGMGEVYRARDTRLGRDVAIKVLPSDFALDPERLARFEREAKLLASLNHPNIASIYGLEQADATRFLAMELVEGEDLAARVARGAAGVSETVGFALQLAEALEEAHEKGIVHRDLKPANVMVSAGDRIKVLDFGLGKALEADSSMDGSALSRSPTLTHAMTGANVILGTAAYMSPEQARGRPVDRRADIWAFGCVLFEMLTGRRTFEGETVSDTLASVLKVEPDWGALPRDVPASLRTLLRRCLEKDPKLRLRDIGEARVVLKRLDSGADLAPAPAGDSPTPARARLGPLTVVVALAAAAAAGLLAWVLKPAREPDTAWVDLMPPAQHTFESWGGGQAAFSPDGSQLAFVAADSTDNSQVWIRDLASGKSRPLAGSESGYLPFWAPDGRALAFFADGKLKRTDAAGGAALTLCDAEDGSGGTWSRSGTILFGPDWEGGLMSINAAGGDPQVVVSPDSAKYRWPQFLPDGTHFLYCDLRDSSAIHVGSLSGKASRRLPLGEQLMGNVSFADGLLFYVQEGVLRARPFDPDRLAFSGEAMTIASPVSTRPAARMGNFAVAPGGFLAFLPSGGKTGDVLATYDRGGRRLGTVPSEMRIEDPALSPDGKRLAMSRYDMQSGEVDVWVYDFDRELFTRLTLSGRDDDPVWSPDGTRIVWAHGGQLYVKSSSGAGAEERLFESPGDHVTTQWSPDGHEILFTLGSGKPDQILMYGIESRAEDTLRASPKAAQNQGQISPDGRWLAYSSDESGKNEVYVQDFPAMQDRWQVSTQGGRGPRWKGDGTELYYMDPKGSIVGVEVSRRDASLTLGKSSVLFETASQQFYARHHGYVASPDGTRFVVIEPASINDARTALTLVLHWRRGAAGSRKG